MVRQQITTIGNSPALLLSPELLKMMGIAIGDEVDMSVVDRTLILRPRNALERIEKIEAATLAVFERRKSAYEELAKGAD